MLNALVEDDFYMQDSCPWCESTESEFEYTGQYECKVVRCKKCGLVYATKVLNSKGLEKYWSNYESAVHCQSEEGNIKRQKMYALDYQYIAEYLKDMDHTPKVLDIGCADGSFLQFFKDGGCECYGVEYGDEAVKKAETKFKLYVGNFPELEFDEKYDLIIFRGTIQYLLDPKAYFKKAVSLLNDGGLIFITSSPNADALCFKLFKERFTQPVAPTDRYAFTEKVLSDYFYSMGVGLIGHKFFYEETPYANKENDIIKVREGLNELNETGKTTGRSPSFYDNMLTLVYKKF